MAASKLPQRFAPTDLTDANIAAGAAIATSKLADSANFILKGGSVAFTGDQSMGNNKLTNVATPSTTTDAANKSYVDGLYNSLPNLFKYKDEVKAMITTNINLSNPGTSTFDGVTLSTGERFIAGGQSTAADIGIYVFATSSTPATRAPDMDAFAEIPGALVGVAAGGTLNGSKLVLFTNTPGGTLGSTAVTYTVVNAAAGYTTSNFVDQETPSGTVNGSNTAFTLANTPTAGTVYLWLEGWLLYPGSGNDYTISGNAITMLTAPLTGERLRSSYRK